MLILTFKESESLHIGDDITIKVSRKPDRDDFGYSDQVTLALDAPIDIKILREELIKDGAGERTDSDITSRKK